MSTVVKTKTGSWVRTLLASGGLVCSVCPYTDTVTDTRPVPGATCKQSVSNVSTLIVCDSGAGGIKIIKVATQFPTKKRKLNHHNYPVCPGLEYKNDRGRLHGVTVVQNLYRNLSFTPAM